MALALPPPKAMESGEDFEKWLESVEMYMGAMGISNAPQKKSIVLHLLGSHVQSIFKNLPDVELQGEYNIMKAKLKCYYKPRVNTVVERHLFNTLKFEDETVPGFVAKLRNQANKCEYPDAEVDNFIRDRLLVECPSRKVKERMLREDQLTLDKAVKIWLTDVQVKEQALKMEPDACRESKVETSVNKIDLKDKFKLKNRQSQMDTKKSYGNNSRQCYRCGNPNHMLNQCKVPSSVVCHNCSKKGHLRAACKAKQNTSGSDHKNDNQKVSLVEDNAVDESYCVFSMINRKSSPYKVVMDVNKVPIEFILDTGSPVTIVPEHIGEQICNITDLKLPIHDLKCYSGMQINILGMVEVEVKYGNTILSLSVYVAKGHGPPLLGREWLEKIKIDWRNMISNVNLKSKFSLNEILDRHKSLFDGKLGTLKGRNADLTLKSNYIPTFRKARPVPYNLLEPVERELERWENLNIIEPLKREEPTPSWATPLVVVPKPDNNVRLCGDFRVTLNPNLIIDDHPLPRIEDMLATIGPVSHISVIDLSQAYLQMKLSNESKKLCYINTHKGIYKMLRLPYGVASAPSIFQREMDHLLKGVPGVKCLLDDVLISAKSEESALERLNMVLEIMESNGLKLKREKCKFMVNEVKYLGVIIGSNGIKADKQKLQPVLDAPRPNNVKELRTFLGAVTFYSKFLKNLSQTSSCLNALLKKGIEWKWDNECESSFLKIKSMLTSSPILDHYDPKLPLTLVTDAGPEGLGAVLCQGELEKPVMFVSRSLSTSEKNYSQIDRECLCIIFAFERLRQFLLGRKFKLVTDNKPLSSIISGNLPALAASRIQRWVLKLCEYNYTVEVRRSEQIPVADWLSRLPYSYSCSSPDEKDDFSVYFQQYVSKLSAVTSMTVARETRCDIFLAKVMHFIQNGWPSNKSSLTSDLYPYFDKQNELSVEAGCILWGLRVVIPAKLHSRILSELHVGHQGIVRMKQLARCHVWWHNIDRDIESESRSCEGCIQKRAEPPKTFLHPWEYPKRPWHRIHIDFAGPIGNTTYFVICDAFSKWLEVFPMQRTTSDRVINILLSLFARWGMPLQLVSDNGPQFTSEEFKGFLSRNGIKHILTAPFHPATNGCAERSVGVLKNSIKASLGNFNLHNFLLANRNTVHATTGRSPSEMMLGRKLRTRLDLLKPDINDQVLQKQDEMCRNSSKHDRDFDVGDCVLARDYRGSVKWKVGKIKDVLGGKHFLVEVGDLTWKRHIDQLLKFGNFETTPHLSVTPPDVSPHEKFSPTEKVSIDQSPTHIDVSTENNDSPNNVEVHDAQDVSLRRSQRVVKPIQRLDL